MGFTLPNGYKSKTTFMEDFMIADKFGIDAIKDTYKRAFKEWKSNKEYLTELTVVMNLQCWRWYEKNDQYCKLYSDLYYQTSDYARDKLKGDDLKYFYDVTD